MGPSPLPLLLITAAVRSSVDRCLANNLCSRFFRAAWSGCVGRARRGEFDALMTASMMYIYTMRPGFPRVPTCNTAELCLPDCSPARTEFCVGLLVEESELLGQVVGRVSRIDCLLLGTEPREARGSWCSFAQR